MAAKSETAKQLAALAGRVQHVEGSGGKMVASSVVNRAAIAGRAAARSVLGSEAELMRVRPGTPSIARMPGACRAKR